MATINPCAWWHTPVPSMTPLEALRAVCKALESGEAPPPPAALIVARGLRQWLDGDGDLVASLGLRPARGKRCELTVERKINRDELIREVFTAQDGTRTQRAKATAALLAAPPGEITEADVMGHLLALHQEHGGDLPQSWSQVLRVVGKD
jgi:hypothetical protein